MASISTPEEAEALAAAHTPAQAVGGAWPKPALAWYAVAIFAVTLMFNELDKGVISLLVAPIKRDFALTDVQIAWLLGPAVVAFNALVGVPISRYIDVLNRRKILTISVAFWAVMTSFCGLALNFWQLFFARMGVGIGTIVHGPAVYSMMADYFPRERLPRAVAVMQIGYVAGGAISLIAGGMVIAAVSHVSSISLPVVGAIHSWQLVFIIVGVVSLLGAALMYSVPEPARRGVQTATAAKPVPLLEVIRYLFKHWPLFAPMFLALAVSGLESLGIAVWRPTFFQRTYGWTAPEAGRYLGFTNLICSPIGIVIGWWLAEKLGKTRDDANLRVVAYCYTIGPLFAVAGPLMPSPWLALACAGVGNLLSLAGAVPQNAALQSVTPHHIRGQVTALYLFIFTVIGQGLGPIFMGAITNYIVRDESLIRYSIAGSAAVMMPLACVIVWWGLKPYGAAIKAIKAREAQGLVGPE